nr:MAG TPA: hypothetical protein [Caudoviricetes sp.]
MHKYPQWNTKDYYTLLDTINLYYIYSCINIRCLTY